VLILDHDDADNVAELKLLDFNKTNIIAVTSDGNNAHISSDHLHYFKKPLDIPTFLNTLVKIHQEKTQRSSALQKSVLCEPYLIGNSYPIQKLRKDIQKISESDLTVLILGQTGTGKGVVAFSLHNNSSRKVHNYLEINCASVPSSLLESELFGYKKGAFTGAWKDKVGKFQVAEKGTIFLDEIAEMTPAMQAKLLQVLQEGEFSPVGSVENVNVNVRVVAATNSDIQGMMREGRFREDLYYRLSVINLTLPKLKDRKEDIPTLSQYFLEKYCRMYNKKNIHLSDSLYQLFECHDWPGNVRELENMIKMVVALESEAVVFEKIRPKVQNNGFGSSFQALEKGLEQIREHGLKGVCSEVAKDAEKKAIAEVIKHTNGNKKKAAKLLDISYKSILNKVNEYGL
jgi:two-component system response regulator AtoC